MTKPITPDEVVAAKARSGRMPQIVEAANALIAQRWNGRAAQFTLRELADLARQLLGMDDGAPFADGDLDIEPVFRDAGWSVEFDRPGYNESYEAFFRFTRKPR